MGVTRLQSLEDNLLWKCIPVTVVVCGTIVAIPHIKTFIQNHPLPGCATITRCHFVWEPDTKDVLPSPLSTMRGPYDWPETYVPPVMISPPYATYHSVVKKEKDKIKEKEKDKPQQNVPEPSSLTLLGLGLILLLGIQYLFSRKRP